MSLSDEILSFLDDSGLSVNPSDLAKRIRGLDVLLAATLLRRLKEKGLVSETADYYYRITEKGVETVREKE